MYYEGRRHKSRDTARCLSKLFVLIHVADVQQFKSDSMSKVAVLEQIPLGRPESTSLIASSLLIRGHLVLATLACTLIFTSCCPYWACQPLALTCRKKVD